MTSPKIVTHYEYPPIPMRDMDWSAVTDDYDGAPDSRGLNAMVGHGATEFEAIQDLMEQINAND